MRLDAGAGGGDVARVVEQPARQAGLIFVDAEPAVAAAQYAGDLDTDLRDRHAHDPGDQRSPDLERGEHQVLVGRGGGRGAVPARGADAGTEADAAVVEGGGRDDEDAQAGRVDHGPVARRAGDQAVTDERVGRTGRDGPDADLPRSSGHGGNVDLLRAVNTCITGAHAGYEPLVAGNGAGQVIGCGGIGLVADIFVYVVREPEDQMLSIVNWTPPGMRSTP